jgi:hypothetical protein
MSGLVRFGYSYHPCYFPYCWEASQCVTSVKRGPTKTVVSTSAVFWQCFHLCRLGLDICWRSSFLQIHPLLTPWSLVLGVSQRALGPLFPPLWYFCYLDYPLRGRPERICVAGLLLFPLRMLLRFHPGGLVRGICVLVKPILEDLQGMQNMLHQDANPPH